MAKLFRKLFSNNIGRVTDLVAWALRHSVAECGADGFEADGKRYKCEREAVHSHSTATIRKSGRLKSTCPVRRFRMESARVEQLFKKAGQLLNDKMANDSTREEFTSKVVRQIYECLELRDLIVVFNTNSDESDDDFEKGIVPLSCDI